MNKKSSSSSGISIDSLEMEHKKKSSAKDIKSIENVDTILVPFYEKDVLMKVPKGNKNQPTKLRKGNERGDKSKRQTHQSRNYLVNKDPEKNKKSSYLEMFRKQLRSSFSVSPNRKDTNEIRSISPEFGDTERESIENEIGNNPETEFYNTESYNEIYYEKLMNRELKQYFDDFMEDQLRLTGEISKTPEYSNDNNLKSVSEVSQPHRQVRRVSMPPIQNVRLGGLGPDTENIKPRLQRARSLQRYSEKVRMENRLRIYKKTIEAENEQKAEREASVRKQGKSQNRSNEQKENKTTSYLFNKTVVPEKSSMMKRIYSSKSKSADVQKSKDREKIVKEKKIYKNENNIVREDSKRNSTAEGKQNAKERVSSNVGKSSRVKSSARTKGAIRDEKQNTSEITPVHISFLVNVGGVRPSSALKTLEAQHRVYQDKVKAFMESNKE